MPRVAPEVIPVKPMPAYTTEDLAGADRIQPTVTGTASAIAVTVKIAIEI